MRAMHVLLIEDDLDLGQALQQAMKAEGISSEWLRRAVDAPQLPDEASVACVLLDLTLPDGTGFELLRRWRREGASVPIIIITARSALPDRLRGLDDGADDFLVKPFATAELASRIRAVVRRYALQASNVWTWGELEIEPRRHVVRLDGLPVELSQREFRLLLELWREGGAVVPKQALAQRLNPLLEAVDFSSLEVHVFNLRRKIGAHRIRTVRGVGYRLAP